MEETTMRKSFSLTALGFMLAVIFAAALPARAADVDQRIRTLEDELARLKTEQAEVKSEQIELKKNALAAEGALPAFSYRPGNGILIEAADKSWSLRASFEAHMRWLFESGVSHAGRTNGEVMGRRFRPTFDYCVNNCLWELEYSLDNDGFGTGNGKNSTGGVSSTLQRGIVWAHFEQFSPWLPTFYFGMDGPSSISEARQGSSTTGSQREYDLLSRNNGFNTGRFGQGFGFNWADKPLDAIGIPGKIKLLNLVMATIGEGDDGLSSNKDVGGNFDAYIGVQPFSQLKSKWIQGLQLEVGAWFCRIDPSASDNGCNRLRLQDNGDGGRQTLFDTGARIGRGWTHFIMPGVLWEVGPYRLRVAGGFQRYDENGRVDDATPGLGKTQANMFLIGHDLFLWSPKGFLTGSASTPGSVLFGTHFERVDVTCNAGGGKSSSNCGNGTLGGFNRSTILLREWDLWYFIMNRMSVGVSWLWYDASNLPLDVAHNLGIHNSSNTNPGKGGNWMDMSLTYRWNF
jgi:hypothetical protein